MKVLCVGGAGYIGTALARQLLSSDTNFEFDVWDKQFGQDVRNVKGDGYDVVVDLAALRLRESEQNPEEALEVNYKAAVRLAETSKHFVFASSTSIYGVKQGGYATEDDDLYPTSVYAKTKALAEAELKGKRNCTILRFATAYGLSPKFRLDLLIHEFILDAVSKGKITLFGSEFYRPVCNVNDLARGIMLAIEKQPGEVYNVGNTLYNFTKHELALMVQREVPSCDIEIVNKMPDPRNYRVSFELIKKELGFSTTHEIQSEIADIVAACQNGFTTY